MDGMLSQEEINALLNGGADSSSSDSAGVSDELSEEEKDAVGEISNISMGTAATTLYSLVNQKVTITTPKVSVTNWEELASSYDRPCVFLQINYREGIEGNNVLVLRERDVKIITDLMMGGIGQASDEPIGELHLSAIGEAMNQMMGSAATSLSSMLKKKIDISPPVASVVDLNEDIGDGIPEFLNSKFVKVAFRMVIGDLVDSEIMQLYPLDFAKSLFEVFTGSQESATPEQTPAPAPAPTPAPTPEPTPAPAPAPVQSQQMEQPQMNPQMGQMPMGGQPQMNPQMGQPMMNPYMGAPYMGNPYMPMGDVNVQQAQFQSFNAGTSPLQQQENIGLIMDVPLEVVVELGRTSKSIKEILEFAPGTIVELNKIAGETVDVLVNGKYVAKGEVVVIEESFGVRITEIVK